MADANRPALRPLIDHKTVLVAARWYGAPEGEPAEPAERIGPAEGPAEPAELLSALRLLGGLRSHLDELERALIEGARDGRVSWSQIASALGLASRQAAEQRWLRLCGDAKRDPAPTRAARSRQRSVDARFGAEIAPLRVAARAAHRQLRADPAWDGRHPRAALARRTLELAGSAAPSAMFTLVEQVVEDLERMPAQGRGSAGTTVLRRLRVALSAATPTRH